jgi:hypothetical protein
LYRKWRTQKKKKKAGFGWGQKREKQNKEKPPVFALAGLAVIAVWLRSLVYLIYYSCGVEMSGIIAGSGTEKAIPSWLLGGGVRTLPTNAPVKTSLVLVVEVRSGIVYIAFASNTPFAHLPSNFLPSCEVNTPLP